MIYLRVCFILLFFFTFLSGHEVKPDLDFKQNTLTKFGRDTFLELQTEKFEVTALSSGFFTLGIHNGLEENPFDDNKPILFGHPYAKTSYPEFTIDGEKISFSSGWE